jgi:hypothetical protein
MKLEAVGEIGDIVTITIYSQNRNDKDEYDQESFQVEIVGPDEEGTYFQPLIYLGFNKLYIEEGGYRDGLQFSLTHSRDVEVDVSIADTNIARFVEWISQEPYKFSVRATGVAGNTTKMTIKAVDGTGEEDKREVDIYIIPNGELANYIDQEGTGDGTTVSCSTGYHLYEGICVPDDTTDGNDGGTEAPTCQSGEHLDTATNTCVPDDTTDDNNSGTETPTCQSGEYLDTATNTCVPDDTTDGNNGGTETPTCQSGEHLDTATNTCIADVIDVECDDGYHLENGTCVADSGSGEVIPPTCQSGYHLDTATNTCIANSSDPVCESGYHLEDGICISDSGTEDPVTPTCQTGYHLQDGTCVIDSTTPTCQTGYHLEDGQCVVNGGDDTDEPLPPMCQEGYNLVNGVCTIELVCEDGQHIEDEACVDDIPTCEDGYHLDSATNSCVVDVVTCEDGYHLDATTNSCIEDATSCEDGYHIEDGVCVSDRNLDDIPYSEWTEEEKDAKSLEICYLKVDDEAFTTLQATAVRAEGFTNEAETIILHTNKTPIVNGVTQNVTLTMIYKEVALASPVSPMLDSTYTVPRFRIDYAEEYAGETFYMIDEGNGRCYINTFAGEDTLPFGILDIVAPDGVSGNF